VFVDELEGNKANPTIRATVEELGLFGGGVIAS
jgi:hypothetical protein